MKFVIDAAWVDGAPRLQLLDTDTGAVRLEWSLALLRRVRSTGTYRNEAVSEHAQERMNRLIKNLFLLACTEEMAGAARRAQLFGDTGDALVASRKTSKNKGSR